MKTSIIQTDAQNLSETGTFCYPSDTNSTQTPGSKIHHLEKYPPSFFEAFCEERKIDLLTLDKKGQKRIAQDFANCQNRWRRKIGGCRMSKSQVYEDVRDYIEWKKSFLGN